jgi:two-component system probable response regulator PhcQ
METKYDYKKFAILYVDDREDSLEAFADGFGREFRIFTAANAEDGLKIVEAHGHEIGILMTDQRMPGQKGVWLLERARLTHPGILRILFSAERDMDVVVDAVNSGAIYRYISKPWKPAQLLMELRQALEFFMLQKEREELLKERSALLRERMIANRIGSLGLVAAGLSQHIRNSMVAVKTFLDIVLEAGGSDSLRDPDLQRSVRADIEKIVGLLADLRIVSANQTDASFPDAIQPRSALAEILAKLQPAFATRRIQVDNQLPDQLPALQGDQPKFNRLFELLFNDELAMLPAGSRITLSAAPAPVNDKPGLALTLADNGPALPQDVLQLVLDPFATKGRPEEYGINFMICFFIVHHHGGTIEASSPPGGGNLFVIRLPLQPEPVVAGAPGR